MPVNGLKFGSGNLSDYQKFLNETAKETKRKLVDEKRAEGHINPKAAVESELKELRRDTVEFSKRMKTDPAYRESVFKMGEEIYQPKR